MPPGAIPLMPGEAVPLLRWKVAMPTPVERSARTSPRLTWVDTARGISILLVVGLHATLWLGYLGEPPRWLVVFNEVAGFFRMPLFFAAAGLFAQKWMRASWRELFKGKLWLLIWVYWPGNPHSSPSSLRQAKSCRTSRTRRWPLSC